MAKPKPSSILQARWMVRNLRKSDLEKAAEYVVTLGTTAEAEAFCESLLMSPDLCG